MLKFISKKSIINASIFLLICLVIFLYNKNLTFKSSQIIVVSTGTYQTGDTFSVILDQDGINVYEVQKAKRALEVDQNFRMNRIRAGDKYEIFKSTFGTLFEFNYWTSPVDYYNVKKSTDNRFYCEKIKIQSEEIIITTSGTITTTLYEAMAGNKISPELIMKFADIFSWQVDFLTDPRQEDTYKIVYKQYKYKNKVVRDGNILAASYIGKLTGKYTAVYFESQDKKFSDYYTPEGNSLRKMFLKAPLSFRRISSYFALKRFHPILRYWRPHLGIDYAAPTGTPVSSIGDGTVLFAGWKKGFGRFLMIRHNSTYTTMYGHLSRFARGISSGKRVRQNQVVAYVGQTGLATGPHLDFRITQNGKFVNFFKLKFPPAANVPEKYTPEFESIKNNILPLMENTDNSRVKK